VGIMALFLTIFYFTIAKKFEKKVLEDQIDFVIDDFVGNILKPVKPEKKEDIKEKLNNAFAKEDFENSDKKVNKNNKKTVKKARRFITTLLLIIVIIVLIVGFKYKWDKYYIKFLMHSSLLTLLFVTIAETLFMLLIAQNYLSADPNKIKLNIIRTLKNNRCSPLEHKDDKEYLKKCLGSGV